MNKDIKSLLRCLKRNLKFFFFALLYYFIGSFYSSSILLFDSCFSDPLTHREDGYMYFMAINMLGNAINTENYKRIGHSLPVLSFKKHQNNCDFLYRAANMLITHIYREYSAHRSEAIITLESTDIIFPFNYFW